MPWTQANYRFIDGFAREFPLFVGECNPRGGGATCRFCSWAWRNRWGNRARKGLAGLYEVHAEHGDHRAIVGAQLEPRDAHLDSARSPYSSSFARSCELAENPPPTIRVLESYCSHPRMALRARTVATESASEAHTSSMGTSRPQPAVPSIHRATAVLTPEKLKSYGCAAPAFPWSRHAAP